MDVKDEEAVARTLAGDREAFGILVEKYAGALAALAYDRLGDPQAAQEAAQEALVTAFAKLKDLRDAARFGAWVENACLAFAWNQGQKVTYWREEPLEVDGVLEGDWGKWAIEVKTGAFTSADLRGLVEFTRRNPSFEPLLLCDEARLSGAERLGVPAMTWAKFLCTGPKGSK